MGNNPSVQMRSVVFFLSAFFLVTTFAAIVWLILVYPYKKRYTFMKNLIVETAGMVTANQIKFVYVRWHLARYVEQMPGDESRDYHKRLDLKKVVDAISESPRSQDIFRDIVTQATVTSSSY